MKQIKINPKIFFVLMLFAGPPSYAKEVCTEKITSYRQAIACAEERSPDVQRAILELERAKAHVRSAGQWKNPELSADSFSGSLGGEKASETEISLGVPIELGGKISARTSAAESLVAKAEVQLFEAKASARNQVFLKLHRLRQLLHEQEVIEESISTFSKLVGQYSQRLKLSPEQEMTSTVFRMSKSEYELKKIEVLEELASLESFLKLSLGTDIGSLKKELPDSPKTWPAVENTSQLNSVKIRLANADVASAQADLSLAQSEAWPTLIVGPSIKLQSEAGRSDQLLGFNVSFPIPVFNANGAGRAAAASGVRVAETAKNLAVNEQEQTNEELVKVYQQSIAVLGSTLSHSDIEKKHAAIEKLFFRGLVPSSLVIEAHRTYVELEKSRNDRELKALSVLLTIYTNQGKEPEFIK